MTVGDRPVAFVCVSQMYPIGVEQGVRRSVLRAQAPLTKRRPVKPQSPACEKMVVTRTGLAPSLAVQIWLTPAACIIAAMMGSLSESMLASP